MEVSIIVMKVVRRIPNIIKIQFFKHIWCDVDFYQRWDCDLDLVVRFVVFFAAGFLAMDGLRLGAARFDPVAGFLAVFDRDRDLLAWRCSIEMNRPNSSRNCLCAGRLCLVESCFEVCLVEAW